MESPPSADVAAACGPLCAPIPEVTQRRLGQDARGGLAIGREQFALRTDDQVAYAHLMAAGAGIGFIAHYNARAWPQLQRVPPQLAIPSLPCWLAVHREIRSSKVVRRVYDYLAEAIPRALAAGSL